jgi:hypothetical protein
VSPDALGELLVVGDEEADSEGVDVLLEEHAFTRIAVPQAADPYIKNFRRLNPFVIFFP